MTLSKNFKKVFFWVGLATLIGGLIYANSTEQMQTSKAATAAANNGVDQEMAAIESTTVKPKDKPIAWGQIQQYEKQLKQNSAEYKNLIQKADAEKTANNGNVSAATRQAGQASAQKFSQISEQLAAAWEKGNCITRAKTVRATAKTRLANAELAFNNVDSDAINNYNDQSQEMVAANAESLKEVKEDASAADIARMKANMIPQFNRMIASNASLMKQVGELLNQVRQMASGDAGAMAGCAK